MALVHIGLDNKDQAIQSLHKACDERDFWVQWLNLDAIFDGLRSDPRFPELLKKTGRLV